MLKEAADRDETELVNRETESNTNNIFTKSLGAVKHVVHVRGLGLARL